MPIQFTTEGAPASRRLALWQDIVCDVYVQLDCKSNLGSAFRGSVTRTKLGQAFCSEVSSQRQDVFRTPSRIAHAHEDFVLIALGKHGEDAVPLGEVPVPCRVIAFSDDLIAPPHLGAEVADAIPDCDLVEIPSCGHLGYLERLTALAPLPAALPALPADCLDLI